MNSSVIILGAGMSGLAAGFVSGLPVYEANEFPGGICSSYYMLPGDNKRLYGIPEDEEAYRFEIGGGHWIFGNEVLVQNFIRSLTPVKSYERCAAIYFSDKQVLVPYPIQNHLRHLGPEIAAKSLRELIESAYSQRTLATMADWLRDSFGETLCELFFDPFHALYTAGLWRRIAPQDAHKSPLNLSLTIRGAFGEAPPVGYNTTFIYPIEGLNVLAQRMAAKCNIHYNKRVVRADLGDKTLYFDDGSIVGYDALICTLPLNKIMQITGLNSEEEANPFSSVLVINIGAIRGARCPKDHWIYVPTSRSAFHRVGFYSNVDVSFLPMSAREEQNRVSIYVEKAYLEKPTEAEIQATSLGVVQELREWGWIADVEVVDPTWIDVAYTWRYPGSDWREKALTTLNEQDIYQVGRFARWSFQGITDSIRDGLVAGGAATPWAER